MTFVFIKTKHILRTHDHKRVEVFHDSLITKVI